MLTRTKGLQVRKGASGRAVPAVLREQLDPLEVKDRVVPSGSSQRDIEPLQSTDF